MRPRRPVSLRPGSSEGPFTTVPPIQLTFNLLQDLAPAWLPDESALLASSVWPTPSGDSMNYTVAGDSKVYHQALASGDTSTVYDFAGIGIARDVSVVDSVLVAVVGGHVSFTNDPFLGLLQRDAGGLVYRVDLRTGDRVQLPLPNGALSRHAVLSPSGRRIAVEGYDADTGLLSNLWLIPTP